MEGAEIVELIYNHVSSLGYVGWMDKKPIGEEPDSFFIISHIETAHEQMLNRIPLNLNVYTKKTESGLPRRDLLRQIMADLQELFSGVVIEDVYFSAVKTFTTFIFDLDTYDVLTSRFDVIVSR